MFLDALERHDHLVRKYKTKFLETYGYLPENKEIEQWCNSDLLELSQALDIVLEKSKPAPKLSIVINNV